MACYEKNQVEVWDLRDCEALPVLSTNKAITHAEFSAKGSTLLVVAGGVVEAFTVTKDSLKGVWQGKESVSSIKYRPIN